MFIETFLRVFVVAGERLSGQVNSKHFVLLVNWSDFSPDLISVKVRVERESFISGYVGIMRHKSFSQKLMLNKLASQIPIPSNVTRHEDASP